MKSFDFEIIQSVNLPLEVTKPRQMCKGTKRKFYYYEDCYVKI